VFCCLFIAKYLSESAGNRRSISFTLDGLSALHLSNGGRGGFDNIGEAGDDWLRDNSG